LLAEYQKDSSSFDLQIYSDYKYYGNHPVMKWFSKWDDIKKYTPLFDSGYLDRIKFAYNGNERYDYRGDSGCPNAYSNSFAMGEALFGDHDMRFDFANLYKNIPDNYCIFVKSGNQYVFNEQFGLFYLNGYEDLLEKFRVNYNNVYIKDYKYAKLVNACILESIFIHLCCYGFRMGRTCMGHKRRDYMNYYGRMLSVENMRHCRFVFHIDGNWNFVYDDDVFWNNIKTRRCFRDQATEGLDADEAAIIFFRNEYDVGGKCWLINRLIEAGYAFRNSDNLVVDNGDNLRSSINWKLRVFWGILILCVIACVVYFNEIIEFLYGLLKLISYDEKLILEDN
jgi:hypothetical protein